MKDKKLYRSTTNKKIAGVCGGLADFTGIDPTVWRLIFLFLALPGGFSRSDSICHHVDYCS